MPHMPFVASPAPIHRHALCLELRVLINIFPSIILRLISHLSLPGVMLASVVFRVRLKRWHLVEVFVSFITHVLFGSKRFAFSYPSKESCVCSTDNINIVEWWLNIPTPIVMIGWTQFFTSLPKTLPMVFWVPVAITLAPSHYFLCLPKSHYCFVLS